MIIKILYKNKSKVKEMERIAKGTKMLWDYKLEEEKHMLLHKHTNKLLVIYVFIYFIKVKIQIFPCASYCHMVQMHTNCEN